MSPPPTGGDHAASLVAAESDHGIRHGDHPLPWFTDMDDLIVTIVSALGARPCRTLAVDRAGLRWLQWDEDSALERWNDRRCRAPRVGIAICHIRRASIFQSPRMGAYPFTGFFLPPSGASSWSDLLQKSCPHLYVGITYRPETAVYAKPRNVPEVYGTQAHKINTGPGIGQTPIRFSDINRYLNPTERITVQVFHPR